MRRGPEDSGHYHGEQLALLPAAAGGCEEPWGGQSPRALTRGFRVGILKAQAAKSMSDFVDREQCDLWLPKIEAPWVYQGAPLLSEPRGD